jgi:hypothetical protein
MAQTSLNSTGVASSGALSLQSNGTTEAIGISTGQVATFVKDAVVQGVTVGRGAGAVSTNTAVGASALAANTGTDNTAIGNLSLQKNIGGGYNTSVGADAVRENTTGTYNSGFGKYALVLNTTGAYNTALGASALFSNTTASNNTAVGYQAGYTNSTGTYNTFLGYGAGYTSAASGTAVNTFVGAFAGYEMTTGTKNTILGAYNGNQNGLDIRTASNYIVLSDGDGNPRFYANNSYGSYTNAPSGSTQVSLGWSINSSQKAAFYWNDSTSRFYSYTNTDGPYVANGGTSWTNSSDERLKNITGEIQNGLTKVCSLRAAEYTWKSDEEAKPQVGLIAQDVLAVLPQAVDVPAEGATERDGSPAMMGVQYTNVIPLLVAAIKELKAEIDTLKGQA